MAGANGNRKPHYCLSMTFVYSRDAASGPTADGDAAASGAATTGATAEGGKSVHAYSGSVL